MSILKRSVQRFVHQARTPLISRGLNRLTAVRSRESHGLCLAVGRLEATQRGHLDAGQWREAEFKAFSQWNEDGLIQHLIHHVPISNKTFIEFGVEDYREANTRFLLEHSGWSGLIFDVGTAHQEFVYNRSELGWRYPIDARSAFLTVKNVNKEFLRAGMEGDIGLLSIDIDGNDYWVWDAITSISPRIVVAEFNSTFGREHPVAVPYVETFNCAMAHYSRLYFGASLPALADLAQRKGYRFVGCESHGSNAFFVREDVAGPVPAVEVRDGWIESQFRSSRDELGRLTYVTDHRRRLELMADQVVEVVPSGERTTIANLYGL